MFHQIEEKSPEEVAEEAKKKQLVAVIVAGLDGDNDGFITQAEVLKYYQVFHPKGLPTLDNILVMSCLDDCHRLEILSRASVH